MRRWLRNRRRWQARRERVLHERTLDASYDRLAGFKGAETARLAAFQVRLQALLEIEMERSREGRPEADALLMLTTGALR